MPAARRIAVARLWQETNSFSDVPTTLADFQRYTYRRGAELLSHARGQGDELDGFLDVLEAAGAEPVPLLAASTWCGGPVEEDVARLIASDVLASVRDAGKLDGILFSMHGALASAQTPDLTGQVLAAVRAQAGRSVPICTTLDHHGNLTRKTVESSDLLTAYRHCPHTDMRQTGRRGAELLLALLDGKFAPTIGYRKLPLVTPAETFQTAKPPLKDWFDLARGIEARPGVIDVSLFPVQPWLDAPELGWSVAVVTDNDPALADACAAELANFAWERRRSFYVRKYEPDEAVRLAASHQAGPVVIADGADATNGGSPGDSTCLLREMLRQNISCTALLTMVDPESVAIAYDAGAGATIELDLGAKRSLRFHQPVRVKAIVERFADGTFTISGHISAKVNMGRCVSLAIGSIHVVVSEFAGPGHDPQVFRQIGLEPLEAQIVVVKATVGHMDAYGPIMKLNLPTECPGPSPSYLERLNYRRIKRPMFPFDQQMQWKA